MNILLLLLIIFQHYSFQNKNQDKLMQIDKRFEFGRYIVITGSCHSGSAIEILFNNKIVHHSCGGDGMFTDIDTMDLNKDGRLDFVFGYTFDDYSTLGMLISKRNKRNYKTISITDDLYKTYDCSLEPYSFDNKGLKEFVLTDIDNDGNKDILTMLMIDTLGKILPTDCSLSFKNQELLRLFETNH